jgi:hypothetical protein
VVADGGGGGGGGSGGGGGQRWWGQGSRLVGPLSWNFFFCFMKFDLPRAISHSRHTCNESRSRGSRQRALRRPSGDEWAVPRVTSRHRLCRE